MKWMLTAFLFAGMVALNGAAAQGQSAAPADEHAGVVSGGQTDIALSGYWTFTSKTSGMGTQQTPSNAAGGLLEVRHIASSLVGYEFALSYNGANQKYIPNPGACALVCQNSDTSISGKGFQPSLAYVVSHQTGSLRAFALAGVGFFIVSPGATKYGNNTPVRGAYVVGGGVDWAASQHFGVRLQFRDNIYKAPNTSSIYPATGQFTSSIEPMGGIFYRF
jgi:hypothetical protein